MIWRHILMTSLLLVGTQGEPKTTTWSFNDEPLGAIADGFSSETGSWAVERLSGDRVVLAQKAKSPAKVFNVALTKTIRATDLDLSAHIHVLEGINDQGSGLVWRAKHAQNYYVARYTPLDDNIRLYKVVEGIRTQLESYDIAHKRRQFDLFVTMSGSHIVGKLDGETYLEIDDSTFKAAGAIGLWTEADARSAFDNLVLTAH